MRILRWFFILLMGIISVWFVANGLPREGVVFAVWGSSVLFVDLLIIIFGYKKKKNVQDKFPWANKYNSGRIHARW